MLIKSLMAKFRRWHVACDGQACADPAGAQALASTQRDNPMIHSIRAVAERPIARRWLLATGLTLGLLAAMPSAKAQDTIKVGILHSLSGTMAISETTLKDVMLMLIDEQNKKGGVLGKKLEAVVVDPGFELAAVRREGARADHQGQGLGRCSAAGPRCRASPCCRCSRS